MDNKRSAYATQYWKEGQKEYKCKMGFIHEIKWNKFLAKNCCIKCNGTIYIYKWIKNHLQYTAIPSAHVLWIRAKVSDLKSCIRTSLASAKVILQSCFTGDGWCDQVTLVVSRHVSRRSVYINWTFILFAETSDVSVQFRHQLMSVLTRRKKFVIILNINDFHDFTILEHKKTC